MREHLTGHATGHRPPHPLAIAAQRLWPAAALSCGLVAAATIGYVAIADYSWFDAFYMTIITLGTIGYQEVEPLGTDGRVWTIAVVTAGFMLLVYVATGLTSLFVSGELSRSLSLRRGGNMREHLTDHVIVVGFGRVGTATARAVRDQQKTAAMRTRCELQASRVRRR